MESCIDFPLTSEETITLEFTKRKIHYFADACDFVRQLPYGRNQNKSDLTTLFIDKCGTCSTKHAILKQLAIENGATELKLFIGIFKMNENNMPLISETLNQSRLSYIPEAHCYLKYHNNILDFTKLESSPADFLPDLLEEKEIQPSQITDFKVNYHKHFLQNWLETHKEIPYTLSELWLIREQCIKDLEDNK